MTLRLPLRLPASRTPTKTSSPTRTSSTPTRISSTILQLSRPPKPGRRVRPERRVRLGGRRVGGGVGSDCRLRHPRRAGLGRVHLITSPLDAAGIPHVWDPYEPGSMPPHNPVPIQIIQPFRLLVPEINLAEAQRILSEADRRRRRTVRSTLRRRHRRQTPSRARSPTRQTLAAAEAAVERAPGGARRPTRRTSSSRS